MVPRPSDAHWNLVRPDSGAALRSVVECAEASGEEYLLGGGWAVYAHVPSVPSIDCDVYARDEARRSLASLLARRGLQVGPGLEVEFLVLEGPQELLGTGDPDLGIVPVMYVPERLFQDREARVRVRVGSESIEVPVPTPAPLLVVKLCALRDRALSYRAHEDGQALALLGPSVATMIRSLPQSYFLRKAGKDLADAGMLLHRHAGAGQEAMALAKDHGLRVAIADGCRGLPQAVLEVGRDIAARAGFPDPWAVLAPFVQ